MTIERKSCAPQIKAVAPGTATVVIATLNVRDKDGDVILPGFFGEQVGSLKPAHDWNNYDIGKVWVHEEANEAIAEMRYNLDTTDGKDWHASVKFDFEHPPAVQEYSFGFRVREGSSRMGDFAGQQVRFLGPMPDGSPGIDFVEVSPVTRGAGQRTRTLAVKEEKSEGECTDVQNEPPHDATPRLDVKELNLSQLLSLLVSQIDHLTFVQGLREQRGKHLSQDTISMIDDVSMRFGELRAKVHLGNGEPDPLAGELEASLARVQALVDRDAAAAQEQKRTEDASLVHEVEARLARISATLHP